MSVNPLPPPSLDEMLAFMRLSETMNADDVLEKVAEDRANTFQEELVQTQIDLNDYQKQAEARFDRDLNDLTSVKAFECAQKHLESLQQTLNESEETKRKLTASINKSEEQLERDAAYRATLESYLAKIIETEKKRAKTFPFAGFVSEAGMRASRIAFDKGVHGLSHQSKIFTPSGEGKSKPLETHS